MGFMTGSFLTYAMSLLELYPRYLCKNPETGAEYECTPDQFCGTKIQYRVDFDYFTSLHNWVEDLDLTCTPKSEIGLIGSMFFAGWAVSATFLPRLADLFGRKKVYLYSMICHGIFYSGIILSHNIKLTTALQFFMGMASVGRASVGFLYTLELLPQKKQALVGTIL
jgi:MFS family permease